MFSTCSIPLENPHREACSPCTSTVTHSFTLRSNLVYPIHLQAWFWKVWCFWSHLNTERTCKTTTQTVTQSKARRGSHLAMKPEKLHVFTTALPGIMIIQPKFPRKSKLKVKKCSSINSYVRWRSHKFL